MAEAFVGTWVLDGKSDSIDALLEAQGVGFMKRKVLIISFIIYFISLPFLSILLFLLFIYC